jgi:hypothetical protein
MMNVSRGFVFQALPLKADLGRLSSIIGLCHLLEPRMVQSLLRRYPLRRVIHKDFPEQVEEVFQESVAGWDDVLLSPKSVPVKMF